MLMPRFLLSGEFSDFENEIRNLTSDIVIYKKGEPIICIGSSRSYCYYVLDGLATFSIIHESGHVKTCTYRGIGTIFPLYYDFNSTIMEQYTEFRALTDIQLLRLTRQQLYLLMTKYTQFSIAMANCYCKYVTMLQYDLSSQMFDTALAKISNFLYLYLLYTHPVISGIIELSQEDIGNIIGLSRSNTSRALSVLKNEGIIRTHRGMIQVINVKKLTTYCSDISFYF